MNGFDRAQWAHDSAEPPEPSLRSRIEESIAHMRKAMGALEDASTGIDEPDTQMLFGRVDAAHDVVAGLVNVAEGYLDD